MQVSVKDNIPQRKPLLLGLAGFCTFCYFTFFSALSAASGEVLPPQINNQEVASCSVAFATINNRVSWACSEQETIEISINAREIHLKLKYAGSNATALKAGEIIPLGDIPPELETLIARTNTCVMSSECMDDPVASEYGLAITQIRSSMKRWKANVHVDGIIVLQETTPLYLFQTNSKLLAIWLRKGKAKTFEGFFMFHFFVVELGEH